MIDLNKLEKEIDELLEKETSDSLTKWLLNKRVGNLNNLIGEGSFVGMESKSNVISTWVHKSCFSQESKYSDYNHNNKIAA